MTCAHCEALRERIAELEEQLDDKTTPHRILAVRRAYRLTSNEAYVFLSLYDGDGKAITTRWLYQNRPEVVTRNYRAYASLNDVKVMIHRVRKKTAPEAIEMIRGCGYAITAVGKAMVEKALAG